MLKLRAWQQEALARAIAWFLLQRDRHFVINAAPGAGKTLAAIAIAHELLARDLIDRIIVIAPRKTVVDQWAKDFEKMTGRPMARITGKDSAMQVHAPDLAATWSAVKDLSDAFQAVCRSSRTLVICDEHHHAAILAAWGRSADSAFAEASYALILTGTPVRSDGSSSIWLKQDSRGVIIHPAEGSYTLTYGEAVDLGYCRPVTFHRHHGEFSVKLADGATFCVSSHSPAEVAPEHPAVRHLQRSLDFYRLAKRPQIEADGSPSMSSYHASMIKAGSAELDQLRDHLPNAGALVIAPSIDVANAFAEIITRLEGAPPVVVHSRTGAADRDIDLFRRTPSIRWLVSVGMVAEGVDIPRLRVLVYLPNGTTELLFRQAVGRVVRSIGPDDTTRAYVVMPAFRIFEEFARRIEDDMPPFAREREERQLTRKCPVCGADADICASECSDCGHEFPQRRMVFRSCEECGQHNPAHLEFCQHCGLPMIGRYEVSVSEALRDGVITRGIDIDEREVLQSEAEATLLRERLKLLGDDKVAHFISQIPKELLPAIRRLFSEEIS